MNERVLIAIGAAAVIALQLIVAPYIALFGAVPNIICAYCLAAAVVRSRAYGCVMPFALGLVYDFLGQAPVGLMAFSLMVVTVAVARGFARFDNDSLFMAIALMAIGALAVEVLYAVLMLAYGYQASLVDVLFYRVLPGFLYDFACSVAAYFILSRFARPRGAVRAELTQLR